MPQAQSQANEQPLGSSPTRRTVLRGAAMALTGAACQMLWAAQDSTATGTSREETEIADFRTRSTEAGLKSFQSAQTAHFLAMGDAPLAFQREALGVCEALGEAFLAHFRNAGFELAFPEQRLTVVVLRDADSYAKLLGTTPAKDEGGHYDRVTNRLMIFDFRPGDDIAEENARRVNLFTLVHETAHQLTFNTGVCDRRANLPLAILEGLATYVEMWRPRKKNVSIGGVNLPRLEALRQAEDWIPIADLLATDRAFEVETQQLAYAESWLLVHHLLRTPSRRPRFRDYLKAAQGGKGQEDRGRIAEEALGPLARLDRELKGEARRLLR